MAKVVGKIIEILWLQNEISMIFEKLTLYLNYTCTQTASVERVSEIIGTQGGLILKYIQYLVLTRLKLVVLPRL